jgi:hypothetical protein
MKVADIILEQLGGVNRLRSMIGRNTTFVTDTNSVMICMPMVKGINRVRVTLEENDVYTMEFARYTRSQFKYKVKETLDHVYVSQIQELFTAKTGLDTHL